MVVDRDRVQLRALIDGLQHFGRQACHARLHRRNFIGMRQRPALPGRDALQKVGDLRALGLDR
ncbi:conserved hypothetical protein, partial [Ricinus communis]